MKGRILRVMLTRILVKQKKSKVLPDELVHNV